MVFPKCAVLVFLALITVKWVESDNPCVELKDCNTLKWLSAIKDTKQFKEKRELFKCGNFGSNLVHCPVIREGDNSNINVVAGSSDVVG